MGVVAARELPIRDGKVRRLLLGLALSDPLQQLEELLSDRVGMLEVKMNRFRNEVVGSNPARLGNGIGGLVYPLPLTAA